MLFASALEQAGLNPVIALPAGHALVGVWLQPEELPAIVIDEAEPLRKRIQLKELVLIETTYVTSHPAPPFSRAVAAATEVIAPEKDDTFNSAIDVRRARAHRIAPLGLKSGKPLGPTDGRNGERVELTLEEAPALPDFDDSLEEETLLPETPAGVWSDGSASYWTSLRGIRSSITGPRKRVCTSSVRRQNCWRTSWLQAHGCRSSRSQSLRLKVRTKRFIGGAPAR